MVNRIPLVVDTDTAADDCFALLIALTDPRADLRAITMVAGNVGFDQQVENAFLTLEIADRAGEVPVHLGAREPILRSWASASEVHGDGVGGQRRSGDTEPVDEHAVDALVRLAAEHPGELKIAAIGPLTNIAYAVRRDPQFVANVATLMVMGGSINGRGNITAAAEYNIYVDPEAADIVLNAGFADLQFVTWDPLSLDYGVLDQSDVDRIRALGTKRSEFFVRANQQTFDFDLAAGLGGSVHCDSLAVLAALDPGLVTAAEHFHVGVELVGTRTLGATIFDWRPEAPPANATAITAINRERFVHYLQTMLGHAS